DWITCGSTNVSTGPEYVSSPQQPYRAGGTTSPQPTVTPRRRNSRRENTCSLAVSIDAPLAHVEKRDRNGLCARGGATDLSGRGAAPRLEMTGCQRGGVRLPRGAGAHLRERRNQEGYASIGAIAQTELAKAVPAPCVDVPFAGEREREVHAGGHFLDRFRKRN